MCLLEYSQKSLVKSGFHPYDYGKATKFSHKRGSIMSNADILSRVDHTALKATSSWKDIYTLCEEAVKYHTASVCIPPSYIARAHTAFPQLNLCTVIG